MKNFVWDEEYKIGIERFDEQHKQLMIALKDVYKAMEDKTDRVALGRVINNLIKYAKEHLAAEEAFLFEHAYPDFEEHKKQHKIFMKKMNQFCEDFYSDKFTLHFEIAVFLKNWILNHILVVDKKYTEYFKSRGIC